VFYVFVCNDDVLHSHKWMKMQSLCVCVSVCVCLHAERGSFLMICDPDTKRPT